MTLLVRMLIEARERRLRLCQRGSNVIPINVTAPSTKLQQIKKIQKSIENIQTNNNNQNNEYNVTKKQSCSTGSGSAERTTAMLTIIIAVFLITELPQGFFHLFKQQLLFKIF